MTKNMVSSEVKLPSFSTVNISLHNIPLEGSSIEFCIEYHSHWFIYIFIHLRLVLSESSFDFSATVSFRPNFDWIIIKKYVFLWKLNIVLSDSLMALYVVTAITWTVSINSSNELDGLDSSIKFLRPTASKFKTSNAPKKEVESRRQKECENLKNSIFLCKQNIYSFGWTT